MDSIQENSVPAKLYPTAADAEGFFYETADDEQLGVTTKIYENDSKVKRAKLPRCGKVAVVRDLSAKDSKNIARFMNKDPEQYQMAVITVSTTLDGEKVAIEEIANIKLQDYTILMGMNSALNF